MPERVTPRRANARGRDRTVEEFDVKTLAEAFWAKVDTAGEDCWTWSSYHSAKGYARMRHANRDLLAHRVSYELHFGTIPDGLVIDHLCRNHGCVNPRHLEPVTSRENILRGVGVTAENAVATHCIHGHEFTEQNTKTRPSGYRSCRTCEKTWSRGPQAKRRTA